MQNLQNFAKNFPQLGPSQKKRRPGQQAVSKPQLGGSAQSILLKNKPRQIGPNMRMNQLMSADASLSKIAKQT